MNADRVAPVSPSVMNVRFLPAVLVTLCLSASAFAKRGWIDDFEEGLAKAKAEHKLALVDFTWSDWCIVCKQLDDEVFSKAKFKELVKNKYVLIEVDFPQSKQLPEKKQKAHEALGAKYKLEGFPTVMLLKPDGTELGRVNYVEGGPEAFVAELEKAAKK